MTTHSTEAQASEDGSERPDVGHVGDEDLCLLTTPRQPAFEPIAGSEHAMPPMQEQVHNVAMTLTADCAAGLVSSYRRYNALDSDH
jgi:hypothetical protein